MVLVALILFGLGSLVFLVYACEMDYFVKELWQKSKTIKNSKFLNDLQPHVRRMKKAEQDAKTALEAIKNLHETKKKLNADFKADWDSKYRLLLPPPPTPNRQALRFKYAGKRYNGFRKPVYNWHGNGAVIVEPEHHPIPVGAIEAHDGQWWFGFNNLPGHANELIFMRTSEFNTPNNPKFWAFLPTIKEVNGEYVWNDSKAKALATNIKDTILG